MYCQVDEGRLKFLNAKNQITYLLVFWKILSAIFLTLWNQLNQAFRWRVF